MCIIPTWGHRSVMERKTENLGRGLVISPQLLYLGVFFHARWPHTRGVVYLYLYTSITRP